MTYVWMDTNGHPSTVLVVEDEAITRLIVIESLHDAGFETLEAGDADAALEELAAHEEVSVIVSDINMPGDMDGIELAREVKRAHPDVHMLLTSGKVVPHPDDIPDGLFLAKPYAMATLVRAVDTLMRIGAAQHARVNSPEVVRIGRDGRPDRRMSSPAHGRA
jgi:CheY-like chemotaxis protein